MPVSFDINVRLGIFRRLIDKLLRRQRDYSPVLHEVNRLLNKSIDRNFQVGGRPRWPAVAASTRRRRGRTLDRSGDLRRAATQRGAKGNVTVVGTRTLRKGVSLSYAAHVQHGTRPHPIVARPGGFMVFTGTDGNLVFARQVQHPGTDPRPYMTIQDEDADRIAELLGKHSTEID